MSQYKRRDDGSTFDTEQARDSNGRFTVKPTEKKTFVSDRRPGEDDSQYLERKGIEASERLAEWVKEAEAKGL